MDKRGKNTDTVVRLMFRLLPVQILLAVLDGVVCVAGFSALLIPFWGVQGAYIANILNGVVCILVIVAYAWIRLKRMPRNTEDLLVLPENFGVEEHERIDISVRNMEEVMTVSRQVSDFCSRRGIDARQSSRNCVTRGVYS